MESILAESSEVILNNIIQYVASTYFTTFFAICVITSNLTTFNPTLNNLSILAFNYDQSNEAKEIFQKSVDLGCQAFIISDEVFEIFLEDFYEIHDKSLQVFANKHVLVYSLKDAKSISPSFGGISMQNSIDDIPNILFVEYVTTTSNVVFSTTKFIGRNNESASIINLFELENLENIEKSLNGINLYPIKLKNLQGREITLAIFNYMPYTLWMTANDSTGISNARESLNKFPLLVDGTESWVFIQFCKRLNCSLLISLDEAGEWGEIFDNRTGNGIIGAVVERRAEVGVGALYSWYHESIYLSLSKFISRTGVTCITPKANLRDPLGTPILPFTPSLWLAVGISYLIGVLAYKFLAVTSKSNEEISLIILNICGILVLQSVNLSSRSIKMLFFYSSMLILGLLLGNSYSSSLSSVLTIPQYGKAIDTVEELAASGMEWGSTHDAWIFSILLATQPMILQLLSKFKTLSKENLEQRALKKDMSYSIERLPYGHYAVGEYITEKTVYDYQTLTNDIYYEMCVAMSTKTWPLMGQLDDMILQIFESGVQKYVELDVVLKHSNNKIQMAVERSRHRDTPGPIRLTPLHISGAFIILFIGLAISTIVFIAEKLNFKMKNSQIN